MTPEHPDLRIPYEPACDRRALRLAKWLAPEVLAACALAAMSGASAQTFDDLGPRAALLDGQVRAQSPGVDVRREVALDAAFVGDVEAVVRSGYVATTSACVCTNLNSVTVICDDCDDEAKLERCHTHDRACQDAAQRGGIREHTTFFCTTNAE